MKLNVLRIKNPDYKLTLLDMSKISVIIYNQRVKSEKYIYFLILHKININNNNLFFLVKGEK